MSKISTWTRADKDYVLKHYKTQTIEEMADNLCRSAISVQQFMQRNRIAHSKLDRIIVIELLKQRIVYPEYFRPTRQFYQAIGITQARWWDLYYGREKIKTEEYIAICKHLKIELVDAFEARQIKITFDENDQRSDNTADQDR